MSDDLTRELLGRWRSDPAGAYQSWFLWEERLKNFRSIRRGVQQVADEIAAGRFGVAYRGSSLETVVPLEKAASDSDVGREASGDGSFREGLPPASETAS